MSSKLIREATALHLVQGMKCEHAIPAGHHPLEGYEAIFTFPKGAAVDRDEGTAGDGFDAGTPPVPTVPAAAVLLFVNRFHHLLLIKGDDERTAWSECIRMAEIGAKPELPLEALEAAKIVLAEKPVLPIPPKPTSRKRTGTNSIKMVVRRVPRPKIKIAKAA